MICEAKVWIFSGFGGVVWLGIWVYKIRLSGLFLIDFVVLGW